MPVLGTTDRAMLEEIPRDSGHVTSGQPYVEMAETVRDQRRAGEWSSSLISAAKTPSSPPRYPTIDP